MNGFEHYKNCFRSKLVCRVNNLFELIIEIRIDIKMKLKLKAD